MVKKKNRWLCAALGVSLVVTLSGCGKDKKADKAASSGEMPETLEIFAPLASHARSAGAKDANDMLPFQLMEELTGVHVEWQHPPEGAGEEKFNLLIASGSLPDMIVYNWRQVSGGARMYAEDDIIVPLQDLIDKNMPNLTAFNEERPDIKKQYTEDDGSIFYIPFIRADKELNVFLGPQIRRDWLDKLGLDVPANTDELYEVLKAFKTQDPNGNGQADEVPMTGSLMDNTAFGIGNLLWAFGTHYSFYVKDGEVRYGILDDRMEEGMEYIAKLYREGLIDVDFLINDRTKMDAKMMGDQSGFVFAFQPTMYSTNMNDGTRKVEGIPFLKGPHGDQNVFIPDYANSTIATSIAVTAANKNPEGSLKWLDSFFGGKGLEYMNFGKEGLTFNWEDGYPKLTDYLLNNPDGIDRISMCGMNLGAYDSTFPTLQDWRYYEQTLSDWGRNAIETWTNNADTSGILPPLSFTAEENEKINRVMTDVNTYASESLSKIVVGNEPVSFLGTVQNRVKEMGIEDVLKIYNDAYQRYMAR